MVCGKKYKGWWIFFGPFCRGPVLIADVSQFLKDDIFNASLFSAVSEFREEKHWRCHLLKTGETSAITTGPRQNGPENIHNPVDTSREPLRIIIKKYTGDKREVFLSFEKKYKFSSFTWTFQISSKFTGCFLSLWHKFTIWTFFG